jgi:hypothetical protein
MGTRADFYVGKGKEAEWLGSIAWDGCDIPDSISTSTAEVAYRKAVEVFLQNRDDATFPKDGWPWPWDDSGTTDCSYWFFDDQCWEATGYPHEYWVPCTGERPDPDDEAAYDAWIMTHERTEFLDMSSKKNVTFGKRSGVMILKVGG